MYASQPLEPVSGYGDFTDMKIKHDTYLSDFAYEMLFLAT